MNLRVISILYVLLQLSVLANIPQVMAQSASSSEARALAAMSGELDTRIHELQRYLTVCNELVSYAQKVQEYGEEMQAASTYLGSARSLQQQGVYLILTDPAGSRLRFNQSTSYLGDTLRRLHTGCRGVLANAQV